jgi:hypothetical protein
MISCKKIFYYINNDYAKTKKADFSISFHLRLFIGFAIKTFKEKACEIFDFKVFTKVNN